MHHTLSFVLLALGGLAAAADNSTQRCSDQPQIYFCAAQHRRDIFYVSNRLLNIKTGNLTFDQFKVAYAMAQHWTDRGSVLRRILQGHDTIHQQLHPGRTVDARCKVRLAFTDRIFLISHSSRASYPIFLSNGCPENFAGNINLKYSTLPFWNYGSTIGSGIATRPRGLTNTPPDYEPAVANTSELQQVVVGNDTLALRNCRLQAEPARKLPKIPSVPYLCLTGEASVHATRDHCVR
ncbi:hypothetical protein BU25DRAFT_421903 [Macroventuria anomochaeta]|uniref:Uncharacterized protein n=1 Tax=Macroventuria anomochaeta TaxID=301207 RepID=A0ACB6RYC5_9PLEO|nr:uncharacterized protein BU25DRAFT_421903 [Macroventuria anomochaeta]KAF2626985.1 hypothetical protein BU25DRAFT_421903 [Macroventuria anomochaeta]